MTRPNLALVNTETGEVQEQGCPDCEEKDTRIRGLDTTIRSQAGIIGRLQRELEASDPETHPRHAEMAQLIDRWRTATNHPKAKKSKDRYDLIRARLKDGYDFADLELAIDGLAAFPYRHFGERLATGTPAQRDDQLSVALKDGESVERFAVLGYRASKQTEEA